MSMNENDFSYPNPPDDIPSGPNMEQVFNGFRLPWPRKPLSGKPKGVGKPASNRPGPTALRAGFHRLGKPHLKRRTAS